MAVPIDVRELAVHREPVKSSSPGPRRRLVTRYVLPAVLLIGFLVLVLYALRDTLSPPREVTVVPVMTSKGGTEQSAGEPLFRAPGWIEPHPMPILATAIAEGVVEKLFVVEGQEVKEGQLIARLVTEDANLAVEAAEADKELREAELTSAKATHLGAKSRLEYPLHLEADLAEADSMLARIERESASLPSMLKAAEERQRAARLDWEGKRQGGVTSEVVIARAAGDLESAISTVEELKIKQAKLPVEVAALKRKRDALKDRLQRKTDEVRQEAESAAAVLIAQARVRQAKAAYDTAKLRLDRMEIHAPVAGRVLHLAARPGMRLGGLNSGASHDSSMAATLYQPTRLQVRVDVRLEDVGKVQVGQSARIESAVLPGIILDGEVLMATALADVQKNTLSVKVRVNDPPPNLKPDMLCQVTFLAPSVLTTKERPLAS